MACKVFRNNDNEIIKVEAPNKKESLLFKSILETSEINGDKELALRQWATVYLDAFKEKFGDWETNSDEFKGELDINGEPVLDSVTNEQSSLLDSIEGEGDDIFRKEEGLKKTLFIENTTETDTDGFKIEDFSEIDNRVSKVYDKIRDNLDYQLRILEQHEAKNETGSAHSTQIKKVIETIAKYSDNNRIKGVLSYVKLINKEIVTVQKALHKRAVDGDNMVQVLENYKRYTSLFSSINDIEELYKNAKINDVIIGSKLENNIKNIRATYDSINKDVIELTKKYMAENLNDIKFHRKIEVKWKDRFNTEYNEIYGVPKSKFDKQKKKDWTNSKLIEFKTQIQKDVNVATKQLVYNRAFDITSFATQFLSSLETNSDIVQVVQTVLSEIRDNIIEELTPVEDSLLELFDEFKKTTGGKYNPNSAFKNILDKDANGNTYLKGKYKASFINKHTEMQAAYAEVAELTKEIKAGISKDTVKLKELTAKAKSLYKELYYRKGKDSLIHKKWHTDLSMLSDMDKKLLDSFKSISDASSDNTFGINSLRRRIGYSADALFYKLPSITKSDLERLQGGSVKGLINDKIKDLKEHRPDDVGYESVKASADGRIIRDVPIHFRGKLDPNNQSIDLFSMYKLEAHNGIAFKHRKKKEMFLEMILDVATNKEYYETKGMSFTPLQNLFAKRNKDLVKEGNTTKETVKKLKGMMDSQLYDINKLFAGTIGGMDAQKLVGFINGYTGMLGMSLNYHSALVNLTGGYAQFLMHAISKDVINVNNLKNAIAKYTSDTGKNLTDFNAATNNSYSNQINIMFDTFGGLSIGTDSFLKDKWWKKLANTHGLTVLHQLGEHQLQSIIAMAVLDSTKALDKDGKRIGDKTMLDVLSLDKKGKLTLDNGVVYNEHSPLTEWTKGGRVEMQQLIKYKIQKTLGNYDGNLQGEIMKTPIGRLVLMYRRFFIPLALDRFRGANKAFTKKDDIKEHEKFFSHATKKYEEGSYVTAVRFLTRTLATLKLDIITSDWNSLTDSERSNIHKTIVEFGSMAILGILSALVAQAADDDDNELLYFLAYTMRRMESELAQFSNPKEAFRITKSPFAGLQTIENMTELLGNILWIPDWGERYKSGKRKDELKIKRNIEKMIPVINKMGRENQEMYNYLESQFFN